MILQRQKNALDTTFISKNNSAQLTGLGNSSSSSTSASDSSNDSSSVSVSDSISSSSDSSSTDNSSTDDSKVTSTMSASELSYIENMKDSNVPYYYSKNENDLMYLASSEKKNYYWGLKEEVFLYTSHDRQKHRYITSIQIDSDAEDIVTTCTVEMPYKTELMEYYIPGTTVFMIIGGTFDREVLFIGRVNEVNQMGQTIQVVGQNIGWKFKQYMSEEFYGKIQGLTVHNVVKAIFKELGFEEGKYLIDLWAIPNIDSYTLGENATVKCDGEEVLNVPELKDVVESMKKADINSYVSSKAKVRETQEVADDYNQSTKIRSLDSVLNATNFYYTSSWRQPYGISTELDGERINYTPLEDRLLGTDKDFQYFTDDKSGDGEYTYQTVLENIAKSIDAHFFIVDTTVCFVSFNSLMAMSTSTALVKTIQPKIEFWQLQDDTYELDINQYGYYNTVVIKYKDGTLKRAYDDLVRVYGEISITYEEPELNYEGAQLKAQAYLSAHVRDFGMQVRATVLHSGKITVASFIKLKNPLTMSETLFYVYGISAKWDNSGQTLTCDLDLRYGPENPDNLEIPEAGLQYTTNNEDPNAVYTGNVSPNVAEAAQQITSGASSSNQKALMIYNWVDKNVTYELYWNSRQSTSTTLQTRRANCYDTAMLIYELCSAVGVKCEVWNGTYHFLDGNWGHLWNRIEQNGEMVFADTGRSSQNPIGQHGAGRYIVSGRCMLKNY